MAQNVTVNLFDVSRSDKTQPLSDTLKAFEQLPLEQRKRSDIRLETVCLIPSDKDIPYDVWHLDFAKQRDIGPGKMSNKKGITDITLDDGEQFGEETAALYVPEKRWLLVLNNQYGVGTSRMANYFNSLDPGNMQLHLMYSIYPKIDQSALAKMQAMQNFTEVEVVANVGAFDGIENAGESVLQAANNMTAHRVHLRFMANAPHKKGKSLSLDAARGFVNSLLGKDDGVEKLVVTDSSAEVQDRVINLIEHKIKKPYPAKSLEIVNHRYTYDSKIKLLRRACREWLKSIG